MVLHTFVFTIYFGKLHNKSKVTEHAVKKNVVPLRELNIKHACAHMLYCCNIIMNGLYCFIYKRSYCVTPVRVGNVSIFL